MTDSKNSTDSAKAVKKPKQQRSKQIVRATVEACRKIMDAEGPDALTTNHIAEIAGVNIASLYRWFPNKEAVIAETFEEQVALEIKDVLLIYEDYAARDSTNLQDAVGMLIVDPLISRQIRFLSMHACFYQDNQPDFDVGKRHYEGRDTTLIEEAGQWLATTLRKQFPELVEADCERRAFVATRAAQGLCLAAATDRPGWLREAAFRQEVLTLVMLYLEAPAALRVR